MARTAVLLAMLIAALLVLPAAAGAQDPPPCPGDKTMDARVTASEDGESDQIVATHEVELTADIADRTSPVSNPPDRILITPQDGVQVLGRTTGPNIVVFAPTTPNLTVMVSWRQTTDPGNLDEETKCSASRVFTLPVLAANPSRGVPQPVPGAPRISEFVTFAVAPANTRRDLSPLEVTIRSTGQVRFPRARERLRRWVIPMRTHEQIKYRGSLPNLAYATFPQKCRFWWFVCGPVNSDVASLRSNARGNPDLDGSNAIQRTLAYSQPSRWAAPLGIIVNAFPGAARNRPFGFDVQVRQSGRLLARVRRAGRCTDTPRNGGIVHRCKVARHSTLLR